jgi:hypothetical protein
MIKSDENSHTPTVVLQQTLEIPSLLSRHDVAKTFQISTNFSQKSILVVYSITIWTSLPLQDQLMAKANKRVDKND